MAKTLHYDFLTNPTLTGSEHPVATSPTLSITRATKATMVDADGYIREVQSGEARFTGATFAHNLALQSQDITTSWQNANTTDSANATTDPLGGSTADELIGVGIGTDRNLYNNSAPWTVGRHGRYIFSGYFKASVIDWVSLRFGDTSSERSYFDLTNGVVGTKNAAHAASSISDEGNGWYRCTIVTDLTGETALPVVYLASADLTNTGTDGDSIYVWGLQVEYDPTGARTTPGTYIATTTASVTSLTGTSTKGLLVEEARTNLVVQSEDFGTSWTPTGATVSTNQVASPDGSTTADAIVGNGAGGNHFVTSTAVPGLTATSVYTISAFAKPGAVNWILLQSTDGPGKYFDVSTGSLGSDFGAVISSGIESAANGFYRCWVTYTQPDTVTGVRIYTANADNGASYTAGTGAEVYVWGAQLEAGAFPTSYIPTTTASVTRNADLVTSANQDFGWSNDGGSMYLAYTPKYDVAGTFQLTDFTTGVGGADRIYHTSASKDIQIQSSSTGGSSQAGAITPNTDPLVVDALSRIVFGIATNDLIAYIDGSSYGSQDTAVDVPQNIDSIWLGSNYIPQTSGLNGHIAEIAYFNERLANATLEDYSLNGLPTAFPGTVAGDGGHIWPARSNDPRWAQIITDSGITPSGNFIDDVHQALEAMASDTGAMDDLWKKVKAIYSITDTSEPFTY